MNTKQLEKEFIRLKERVEELECTSDVHGDKLSLIQEVTNILNELPLGHTLMNRALNRSKLRYIRHVVIPRREAALKQIKEDKSMPAQLKENFIASERELITKAKRAVTHRTNFEKRSASTVRDAFGRLQGFLTEKKNKFLPQRKGKIECQESTKQPKTKNPNQQ